MPHSHFYGGSFPLMAMTDGPLYGRAVGSGQRAGFDAIPRRVAAQVSLPNPMTVGAVRKLVPQRGPVDTEHRQVFLVFTKDFLSGKDY